MTTIFDVVDQHITDVRWRYTAYVASLVLLIPLIASLIQTLLHVVSRYCPGRTVGSLWFVRIGSTFRYWSRDLQRRQDAENFRYRCGAGLKVIADILDPVQLPAYRIDIAARVLFGVQTLEQVGLSIYRRLYSVFRPGIWLVTIVVVLVLRPPQNAFSEVNDAIRETWQNLSRVDVRLLLAVIPLTIAVTVFATRGALIERVRMRDEAIKEAAKYAGRLLGAAEQLHAALDAEHERNAEMSSVGHVTQEIVNEASDGKYVWIWQSRELDPAERSPDSEIAQPFQLGDPSVDSAASKLGALLDEVADAGLRWPLAKLLIPIHWHLAETHLAPLKHHRGDRPLPELGRAAAKELQRTQLESLQERFTLLSAWYPNTDVDDRDLLVTAEMCANWHRRWDDRSLGNRLASLHLRAIVHHINNRQAGTGVLLRIVSSFKS